MVDIDIVVNACLQFNFRFVISLYLVVYCRAARTILTHELSCKLDNRLDALAGTFKFFSGYFTSGCRVTEELISPLFPEGWSILSVYV